MTGSPVQFIFRQAEESNNNLSRPVEWSMSNLF